MTFDPTVRDPDGTIICGGCRTVFTGADFAERISRWQEHIGNWCRPRASIQLDLPDFFELATHPRTGKTFLQMEGLTLAMSPEARAALMAGLLDAAVLPGHDND